MQNVNYSKKSVDTNAIFATTSASVTISVTANRLVVMPKSSRAICGLTINNYVIFEIVMPKCKKRKNN